MGNTQNENPIGQARKSLQFYLQIARGISIIVAATGAFTLIKGGELVDFVPWFRTWVTEFSAAMNLLLGPLERLTNMLFAQIGFDVEMGLMFKPVFLALSAVFLARSRHTALDWITPVMGIVYMFLVVTSGFLSSGLALHPVQLFLLMVAFIFITGLFALIIGRDAASIRGAGIDLIAIFTIIAVLIGYNYVQTSSVAI